MVWLWIGSDNFTPRMWNCRWLWTGLSCIVAIFVIRSTVFDTMGVRIYIVVNTSVMEYIMLDLWTESFTIWVCCFFTNVNGSGHGKMDFHLGNDAFTFVAWILTRLWRDLNRNAAFSTNELFTAVTKFTSLLWNESFTFLVWYFHTWIVNFYMDVNASECVSCRN